MKNKKLAAAILCGAMLAALPMPAFADNATLTSNSYATSDDIGIEWTTGTSTYNQKISVAVEWEGTDGSYVDAGSTYTWDAATKKYTAVDETGLAAKEVEKPSMQITVTNNSNVYVDYTVTYASESGWENSFKDGNCENGSAAKTNTTYANDAGTLVAASTYYYQLADETMPNSDKPANANAANKNTATYVSDFNLSNNELKALHGELNDQGGYAMVGYYTVTVKTTNTENLTFTNQGSKTLSASDLLDSTGAVNYTYNGKTYTAYNGYISAAADSSWYDAMAFVQMLNENRVAPDGKTWGTSGDNAGTWRLLSNQVEALAWFACDGTVNAIPDYNVICVWTSLEGYRDEIGNCAYFFDWWQYAGDYYGCIDYEEKNLGAFETNQYSFLVVWEAASAA